MTNLIETLKIKEMIIELRGRRVILDSDLASLYRVSTKRLMEQVKRNGKRFPPDFMFQLTREEWLFWKSQFATSKVSYSQKNKQPYVFTRNGANMVSAILKSEVAIQRSIQIMRAFSALEEIMSRNRRILAESPEVLYKLSVHSKAIMTLFQKDGANKREIAKVKNIIIEMIDMLQKMVLKQW
ncbi:MAG: ORF6N domain-containing protein [bacterium]